jgi:rhodanese-related sulfurtransferase
MMPMRLAFALCVAGFLMAADGWAAERFTLDAVREQVRKTYPQVQHISTRALTDAAADGGVLLVDVREPREYQVSRIPGAIRVDPGIGRAAFQAQFAAAARGKRVVFYCSVGVRSARLAARMSAVLEAEGASVANLDGGIFAWHAEQRALVNAQGSTRFVHPYDEKWGRLVARPADARTAP